MLGYPPAMFFNDSYNYMTDAVTKTPDMVRSERVSVLPVRAAAVPQPDVVTGLQA